MKQILTIAALCLAALTAHGQTVEVVGGSTTRIFLEKTQATDNSTTFAYMEATFGGGAYVQVFREQKWWDTPLYLHGEYRSTFDGAHTIIAGPSYSFFVPVGFFSLAPFYRYDIGPNKHAVQVSACYFLDWGWLELYGYNDAWYDGAVNFFGEERMHFRINEHFKIGAILDVTYFGEFAITPLLGVRYDF